LLWSPSYYLVLRILTKYNHYVLYFVEMGGIEPPCMNERARISTARSLVHSLREGRQDHKSNERNKNLLCMLEGCLRKAQARRYERVSNDINVLRETVETIFLLNARQVP
jgi:hypothetical protein